MIEESSIEEPRMLTSEEEQEQWERALLTHMANCDSVARIAPLWGITLEEAQAVCGRHGHEWTHWEAGDGPWFQAGAHFCEICGVPRDGEEVQG